MTNDEPRTNTHPPDSLSAQTNKQRRRTNRPTGGAAAEEAAVINHRPQVLRSAAQCLRVWPLHLPPPACKRGISFAGALVCERCGRRAPPGRMRAFSERESVHVWDVTQTRAAQHSRLFKGPFILLQLVQLLKTDKQDLELRAAENRPPTPLLKPLRPGPTLHCDWEKKTNKSPQTGRIKVHGESSAK